MAVLYLHFAAYARKLYRKIFTLDNLTVNLTYQKLFMITGTSNHCNWNKYLRLVDGDISILPTKVTIV